MDYFYFPFCNYKILYFNCKTNDELKVLFFQMVRVTNDSDFCEAILRIRESKNGN